MIDRAELTKRPDGLWNLRFHEEDEPGLTHQFGVYEGGEDPIALAKQLVFMLENDRKRAKP